MATKTNLLIDQGSDFATTLSITDSNNIAFNLVGWTPRGQMRKSFSSTTSYQFTVTVSNATGGEISVSLPAATSAAMTAGRYVYDIEIENDGGAITRVLEGIVTLTPEVTRA